MLKNIPLIIALTASLVACGGSDDKKSSSSSSVALSSSTPAASSTPASSTPASSEAASSTPASSEAASSTPASSEAASSEPASSTPASSEPAASTPASSEPASSSMASSSAPNNVLNIDMTTGWRGNNGGTVSYSNEGVTLVATADGQGAVFDLAAPIQLEDAIVEMIINVSNEYKASLSNLQIFAQIKTGNYPGEYGCWTNNADLTSGTDQTITCTIDEGVLFDQTANDVQVGIQAKSTTAIAGTVIIKSAKVTLATQGASSSAASSASVASSSSSSAAAGVINVDVTKDWEVGNGSGAIAYAADGVVYTPATPTQYDAGSYFKIAGPRNFEGATLVMVVVPSATFKAAGYNLQPFAQVEGGTYAGDFHCFVGNADLVADTDNTLTCTISYNAPVPPLPAATFTIADTTPVRFGVQLLGVTAHTGTLKIKSAKVTLAQ